MAGGTGSDWAWGSPSKPLISGAASGTKCWITGGLTGSAYSNGEASWLVSPCFDFSTLQYPFISFNVFWETERRFDGANFQYSTDLGGTWTNVGSSSAPVNCFNENWFNFSPITYLSPLVSVRDGWSGNIQSTTGGCQGSGGSARWVFAKQAMPALAGLPFVIFRFTFGAGTVCNNYDGFAIDNITIGEAPPNNASFSYFCVNNTTVNFINTSALCPDVSWNFGDPASGVTNDNSTLQNPTHTFSGPGTYTITLNATGPNAPSSTTGTVTILGLTTSVISNNNCFGDNNGAASVTVIPAAAAPFNYAWNTVPAQNTQIATGLGGGSHTVTVNAMNACSASATALISSPAALTHTLNIIQPGCGLISGSATVVESGGTPPYTYSWSPVGGTGPTATGLSPGSYTVTVTDSRSCSETINVDIFVTIPPVIATSIVKPVSCTGMADGQLSAVALGSGGPYSYSWNTIPIQTTSTATGLKPGTYTVTVTDNGGCGIVDATITLLEPTGICGDVYFPNAFTPNGDTKNEGFGPLGNIAAISNYHLQVYNRYGEMVFATKDPYRKWDGYYRSKINSPGSYTWHASYTFKGQIRSDKGWVTIIR
jgi:gliding motility-associated-like protein